MQWVPQSLNVPEGAANHNRNFNWGATSIFITNQHDWRTKTSETCTYILLYMLRTMLCWHINVYLQAVDCDSYYCHFWGKMQHFIEQKLKYELSYILVHIHCILFQKTVDIIQPFPSYWPETQGYTQMWFYNVIHTNYYNVNVMKSVVKNLIYEIIIIKKYTMSTAQLKIMGKKNLVLYLVICISILLLL